MIKRLLFALLTFLPLCFANAQNGGELLVDLEAIPLSKIYSEKRSVAQLELPFFDDFSQGLSYPLRSLWDAQHVFVGTGYANGLSTPGVATLDAISKTGELHPTASVSQFSSDTICSHPINLNFPGDTSIYITFWYQPQGKGNQPQQQDSLLLEFFDSATDEWVSAWVASADFTSKTLNEKNHLQPQRSKTITSELLNFQFYRVHFPITDARFLTSNFRLRFRNYASVAENIHVPGLRGNSDHWHIDMVWLDKGRSFSDTLLNDISFLEPMGSILKNYKSVPWSHFTLAQPNELDNQLSFTVKYHNLGRTTWNVTRRFVIENLSNNQQYTFSSGAENIFAFGQVELTRLFLYDFQTNSADSARFKYTSYLITDINPETHHLRWNDTIRYIQSFYNYYAYDDGSSENGYGLYGEGTQNGRVAVRFTNYKPDELKAVYFHFNRTFNDANKKYFKLCVWADANGKPGDLIYEQLGVRPAFTGKLNGFELIELDEPLWIEAGTFYIGWTQITADFLNVGFDLNTPNKSKIFFNISGQWSNTQYDGSLMIRPVFGQIYQIPTNSNLVDRLLSFDIYPNPANSSVSLNISGYTGDVDIKVFNSIGQLVLTAPKSSGVFDVSRLPAGVYVVSVATKQGRSGTKKLIVVR